MTGVDQNRAPGSPESDETDRPGMPGAALSALNGGFAGVAAFDRLGPALSERAVYRLGKVGPATLRAYQSDWLDFIGWCSTAGMQRPLPTEPSTVTGYVSFFAGLLDDDGAHATLERRVAAIGPPP